MRVAISASLWGETPFRQTGEQAKEAGYVGIEGVGDLFGELRLARRVVRDTGLDITAGSYPANWFADIYRDIELDQLRRVAEFFAGVDAKYLITCSRPVPERLATAGHFAGERDDGLLDFQWGQLADTLATAAYACEREFEMTLLFRNQLCSYVETGAEMDEFMALTGPNALFLAPDVGYLFYAGVDPVAFVRRNLDRIRYVTLKDVDAELRERHLAEGGGLQDFAEQGGFVELGEGDVDLAGVVEVLQAGDFDGWLVVDQDRTLRDPAASAQISREHLVGLGLEPESA